jgi:O-antigen/teichoic acid export membrane protein
MKVIANYLSANINNEKLFKWTKLFALTMSAQVLIQVLSLLSGIFIIRLLPTTEYAFYTLANTMLGTMTVLADGGISSGVMAEGGKVWQDREKLGIVVNTGLKLRKTFAVLSLLISMPILFYLLRSHGAGLYTCVFVILSLIPSFYAALSDNLLEVSLKLHQGIGKLQKNQMAAGIGRFLMITGSLLIYPWTFVAILGNGIPRIWANIRLRKMSALYADPIQKANPVIEKEILSVVKRTLPTSIYYCVSGQITIWLISMFGSTQSIAHIGALGRISIVLTVFSTLFGTLVTPRYARLKEDHKLLRSKFIQIQVALLTIFFLIVGLVIAFPSQILWVLGKDYANLKIEVIMMAISSCLSMIVSVTYFTIISRGWVLRPIINISINIFFQLVLVFTLDLSNTKSVLMFSIVDYFVAYIILWVFFLYRIYRIKTIENVLNG